MKSQKATKITVTETPEMIAFRSELAQKVIELANNEVFKNKSVKEVAAIVDSLTQVLKNKHNIQ